MFVAITFAFAPAVCRPARDSLAGPNGPNAQRKSRARAPHTAALRHRCVQPTYLEAPRLGSAGDRVRARADARPRQLDPRAAGELSQHGPSCSRRSEHARHGVVRAVLGAARGTRCRRARASPPALVRRHIGARRPTLPTHSTVWPRAVATRRNRGDVTCPEYWVLWECGRGAPCCGLLPLAVTAHSRSDPHFSSSRCGGAGSMGDAVRGAPGSSAGGISQHSNRRCNQCKMQRGQQRFGFLCFRSCGPPRASSGWCGGCMPW